MEAFLPVARWQWPNFSGSNTSSPTVLTELAPSSPHNFVHPSYGYRPTLFHKKLSTSKLLPYLWVNFLSPPLIELSLIHDMNSLIGLSFSLLLHKYPCLKLVRCSRSMNYPAPSLIRRTTHFLPVSIATLPSFGPIEGRGFSRFLANESRFAIVSFGKIQFLPLYILDLPFMSYRLWPEKY